MSALTDALRHPVNRPRPLVEWLASVVNPGADLRGLEDGGGVVCDFRPGLEEKDPSLSVSVGSTGAVFKRFGGDDAGVGAVAFTMSALNISKGEAAKLLIDRAGIVDTPGEGRKSDRPGPRTGRQAADVARMADRLEKLAPLEEEEAAKRLRGWERLTQGSTGPEAAEVARRGLTVALTGQLAAYRWTGTAGRVSLRLPGHIRPGALAFAVTGPDGKPWALKVRNPGSAEDLKATGGNRYAYIGKGQGAPAFYLPGEGETVAHIVLEGELNAAAVRVMLDTALTGAGHIHPNDAARGFAVQGVGSAEGVPHVSPVKEGQAVYLYADHDAAGDKARQKWAALFHAHGAKVYQIGPTSTGFTFPFAYVKSDGGGWVTDGDACDALGNVGQFSTPGITAAFQGARLLEVIGAARLWTPAPDASPEEGRGAGKGQGSDGDVWTSDRSGYGVRAGKLCALTLKTGENGDYETVEVLADFAALITAEVTQEDGTGDGARVFELEGKRPDGRPMNPPRITVTAAEFSGMGWAVAKWGAAGIIHAGQGKKDKGRAAIQIMSQAVGVPERTVYQHTGWTIHPDHGPVYLTAGAVIGAAGGVQGVDVELTGRLDAYALPDPAKAERAEVLAAVRASLALLDLAPDAVGVPVLGAAYRAVLGPADFALWVTGETGRNKTAYMGLVQAHYGARWSRKYLPDGWNSTANALERSAFTVKDGLFLIDDFKPSGSQSDTAKAQASVSRIFQGLADGAGRGTLTQGREIRAGLWPRGLVMSSSEDLPRGHSNRARAVIVDVTRPLIGKDPALSAAFYDGEEKAAAGVYALALACLVQGVAGHYDAVRAGGAAHGARVRALAPHFQGQHGRTGDAAAELAYGWEVFLAFAAKVGAISEEEARAYWQRVTVALEDTAQGQAEHLTEADPVARALSVLTGLLSQGRVFLEDLREGGPVSEDVAPMCGYERRVFPGQHGEEERYQTRPGADLIGWYSKTGGDEWAHFLPDALHGALQRAVSTQGGAILPDSAKLWANMRDRLHPQGLMKCEAEAGGRTRPTAKATIPDGSRRHLLTLRLPLQGAYEVVGTLGTVGTDSTLSASGTVSRPVPTFNYFLDDLGTMGTPFLVPSSSSPSGPAADSSWDDLTGGVPEGEVMPETVKL